MPKNKKTSEKNLNFKKTETIINYQSQNSNSAKHKETDREPETIPPLSQYEKEHLTYLRVLDSYNEFCSKRDHYKKFGVLFIICSALVFLALMFSLETKIQFLVLWILTVIYCVVLMIRADYKYNYYKELLGIADEFDILEYDAQNYNDGKIPKILNEKDKKTDNQSLNEKDTKSAAENVMRDGVVFAKNNVIDNQTYENETLKPENIESQKNEKDFTDKSVDLSKPKESIKNTELNEKHKDERKTDSKDE